MTILITGATGLIGTELSQQLVQSGHTIHYLTTSKQKCVSEPHYKGFYWNIACKEIDTACLEGVDVIVHLAGASIAKRWTKKYREEIISSRIDSANLLFDALSRSNTKIKHFISASGTAIYPESYSTLYSENNVDTASGFLADVVKQWEATADKFLIFGKVTKVRTGVVLSSKGGALQPILKPIAWGFGSYMGSGNQYMSWIHIQDLVNVYHYSIKNALEGVVNGVAEEPVTNKKLTQCIANLVKKPLILPAIPAFMLKLMLGQMSELILKSEKVTCQKLKNTEFRFTFKIIDKALIEILGKK